MYDKFKIEYEQDIIDYCYDNDVIDRLYYIDPKLSHKKTKWSDNLIIINITYSILSTTYVLDINSYFDWKIIRDRKIKLEKIMKNV